MREKVYKGSSKTMYDSGDETTLVMSFEDTVKVNKKIFEVSGKGAINNSISAFIMDRLTMAGIENHFIQKNNMRQQLVQVADVIPVVISVTNVACGRYVTDFGMEEGLVFDAPIIDYRIKSTTLNYPVINESQIINFGWSFEEELREIKALATRVHDFLTGLFAGSGIRMVECKLEIGRVFNGEELILMLADEISPDTCRLWDMKTNEKLCFEILEENPEKAINAYKEVMNRLNIKKYSQ